VLREALASTKPIPLKRKTLSRGPSKVARRNFLARERNRSALELGEHGGPDQSPLSVRAKEQYAVQFLKDPLKLASAVLGRLRIGDVNGAVELVRASDREKVENVVSWNHIMDYEMNFQNVKGALRVYNEVGCYFPFATWLADKYAWPSDTVFWRQREALICDGYADEEARS
jgi:hypothetical protein